MQHRKNQIGKKIDGAETNPDIESIYDTAGTMGQWGGGMNFE